MRVTEATFSFLPELGDEQIHREIERALARRCALSLTHAAAPASPAAGWEEWGGPVLDAPDAAAAMDEVKACRAAFPGRYVKLVAFEPARGGATACLELLVQRGADAARAARGRRAHPARREEPPRRSAS